jgi:ClpP class serine protease
LWTLTAVTFSLFDLFWIFFIISSLQPLFQRQRLSFKRIRALQELEHQHRSRVILLIHRQESISLLGIPLSRYITIEDSEQILRAIRLTPSNTPIDLILHTPGGLVLATEQIARALIRHSAKVTVFIPHYAMSGGTMLALAADEIVMDANAVLGPVDPQLGNFPAASILNAVARKPVSEVDDETLIMADLAEKAIVQVQRFVRTLLSDTIPTPKILPEKVEPVIESLTTGRVTHDYPITVEEATELGLPITVGLPRAIYDLMELYPQPQGGRPSVQYIPMPYQPRLPEPKGRPLPEDVRGMRN